MSAVRAHQHDGAARASADPAQAGAPAPRGRSRRRRAALTAAAVLPVGVLVAVVGSAVSGAEDPDTLSVVVSDAGSTVHDTCPADKYAESFFDGAEIALLDAAGAVVGATTLDGAPSPSPHGCHWTTEFADVPDAAVYTLRLRGDGVMPREHSWAYTPEQLAGNDWRLWVTVFA
jgi:hypothetical protein